MNNTSTEQTPDRTTGDEPQVTLQKVFKKVHLNFNRLEKCVGLCKEVLSECCDKLEELRSQMNELESMMEEAIKNDTQMSLDSSERIQGKNQLKEVPNLNITEDVTVIEREKCNDSSNSYEATHTENQRKKLKTNPENDKISNIPRENHECVPGPSQEEASSGVCTQSHSQERETVDENLDFEIDKVTAEDVIEKALQNTEGVLSVQEMKSFLRLSEEVEDPVQLAKNSFTTDIKSLCIQLKNFHFLLKNHELDKRISDLHKELEIKVRKLIDAFEAQVVKSQEEHLHESAFPRFRPLYPSGW